MLNILTYWMNKSTKSMNIYPYSRLPHPEHSSVTANDLWIQMLMLLAATGKGMNGGSHTFSVHRLWRPVEIV